MKLLKILLGIILALVVIFLVLSATGPKNYKVERSALIKANDSIVYSFIGKFSNWASWSPWNEKDPGVTYTLDGEDGKVGTTYSWTGGNPDITGTGSMKVIEATPGKSFKYQLAFTEPWEMSSQGGFIIEAQDSSQTKITWIDEGDIPFSQRAMMHFMNLDKMMGPDFERGLFKIDSIISSIQISSVQ